jgi:hypothetical protein
VRQGVDLTASEGRAALVLAALVVALAGCGGSESRSQRPGFTECVDAWNAESNAGERALVARKFVAVGYRKAAVGLSMMGGGFGEPDPNPVGCRVVFFNAERWVAYLAARHGESFRFHPVPRGYDSPQSGVWPKRGYEGSSNAQIVSGAKLRLTAQFCEAEVRRQRHC